jgi:hypothetical protein
LRRTLGRGCNDSIKKYNPGRMSIKVKIRTV